MSKTPYFKLYTADYRDGTRELSFEERGFYVHLLTLMWDSKSGVPADAKRLAVMLQCNPRTVAKLTRRLIALGKLIEDNGSLINPRMMRDIGEHENRSAAATGREAAKPNSSTFKPNSAPIQTEFSSNSAPIEIEFEAKKPETPIKTTEGRPRDTSPIFHIPESIVRTDRPFSETPREKARACGRSFWSEAMAPPPELRTDGASLEHGSVVLRGSTREYWLKRFDGDDLRLETALQQAYPYVCEYRGPVPLESRVASQLARIIGNKLDSDRRYAQRHEGKAEAKARKSAEALDALRSLSGVA